MGNVEDAIDWMRRRGTAALRENGIFFLLAALIAYALKQHYSQAGSDELTWILRPTAWLVERSSGIRFEWESHSGFVDYGRRIVIAPACAGVNFLIVAFAMAACAGFIRIAGARRKLLWLTASLCAAYGLTLVVNALRIRAAIASYEADLQLGWLTADRFHRLQGVVIYFFFLCLFYRIISAILPVFKRIETPSYAGPPASERPFWMIAGIVPFCWYTLMTLAAPLLNHAAGRDPARFLEHSWMVICGCFVVAGIGFFVERVRKRSGS